jgi:hypothetical protein
MGPTTPPPLPLSWLWRNKMDSATVEIERNGVERHQLHIWGQRGPTEGCNRASSTLVRHYLL